MSRSTREEILDAAETLFAEQGFDATSLRAITRAAGANLASVNYHFGSKDALVLEVVARRVRPMNSERLRRLEDLQDSYGQGVVPARELIEAFVAPALALSRDRSRGGERFVRLLGRALSEPGDTLHEQSRELYQEVSESFKPAFAMALPWLQPEELYWRMHFMVGLLAYLMAGSDIMRLIASSRIETTAQDATVIERLVNFIEAGMCAPAGGRVTTPVRVARAGRD